MKALRFALSLLCWTLLFSLWGAAAQAAGFAPALTVEEGRPGGVVEVAFPYDGSLGEVAAFRAQVEYDPTVLEYLRPTYGESVQAGTVTTQNTPGKVASVYTAPAGGPYLAAEDAIIYRFRILESAVPGLATVFVSVFELSTPEPAAIPEDVDVSLSFQVLEPPSSDARLLSLAPDHGQLQPAFDPDVFAYTMTVPYEVEAVTFTAEPVPGAACRVNRKNLGSGGSDTLFRITVTAEDGETKSEYQVTVHRQEKEEEKPELNGDAYLLSLTPASGTLTPAFDPDIYQYSLTVPFEVTTMTFTAEVPEGATYRVNRKNLGAGGSDTLFRITVTAKDGETKKEYHVTVHRQEKEEEEKPELNSDASLLSLTPATGTLTPAFDPDIYQYNLTVPFEVTTMTFTAEAPAGATYRVNRKNLGAGGSDTLFRITVTAEDGETKSEYQVTVHRSEKEEEEKPELSADASLLSLTPATGTLTPAFDPDVYEYSLTVPFEVTTMTFTAEAPEGATYRVNRKNLGAGGSDTVFEITVTAADGETRQVYTVTVHRSEKAVSTGGAGTGSGSSGGGSASQSSGDGDSDTSSGGTEASPERESTEETVPVAGGVGESSSPGGGEGDTSPEGSASGGLVFQNGETSRLPALLVLVAFILFCFLSGPLAKMLAKRFPQKEEPTGK